MNDPLRFPFESEFVDAAGEIAMATFTTTLLLMTGPPQAGESPREWRSRLESSGSELMSSLMLAVEARRLVISEGEAAGAIKQ